MFSSDTPHKYGNANLCENISNSVKYEVWIQVYLAMNCPIYITMPFVT